MARVVVVGSGIAGLTTALHAAKRHDVTVVTKAALSSGSTVHAQGGIAGVMFDDDSIADHVADTIAAGAGLCDIDAVRVLCAEGPERIRELARLGVNFDSDGASFAKGLEAAHSYPRVVHAGGDATGLAIETALTSRVRESGIRTIENAMLVDLVTSRGAVIGAELLCEGQPMVVNADALVLATGGAGQLYAHTTNPDVATGDGAAAALRAGALIADAEFYQFHPTVLGGDTPFLVSEAVRGEGAVLVDAAGQRFLADIDKRGELAPRNVVALGIARRMAAQGGLPVFLDATRVGGLAARFPTIDAAVRASGYDWTREPIPVTPAAHYWMGGIVTDVDGRTAVEGLFAVGEVARTGVHGANRLASNSLLEGAVFGARAAAAIPDAPARPGDADDGPSLRIPSAPRPALQELMWSAAGLERTGDALDAALSRLDNWDAESHAAAQPTRTELENRNLLLLARIVSRQAAARTESRGAHVRTDFPHTDPATAHPVPTGLPRLETVTC